MHSDNSPHSLTLLAPARDIEVARAAIQAGTDAVYIGAPKFGARQAAGNSMRDIATLVQEAHRYGVQVLVTLNTLMTDEERREAAEMAHELYQAGVDALIIQDLRLLHETLPPIRLHASTQCDNRTAEHAVQMQRLGFRRIVLARELTIDEIRHIRQATLQAAEEEGREPIELEAFVHGALCVSYSGRCYASEVLMNRSANRGCCAQMCRMAYDLLDKDGHEIMDDHGQPIHQRYLLSLQDMDRSMYLNELIDAGVTTFKIEGRLKDSDYVTNIVAYYRQLLGSNGHEYTYDFIPNPSKTFHRGATDYFLHGRTPAMANFLTPKSTGEEVGQVLSVGGRNLRVALLPGVELHAGDGISCGDEGFSVNRIEGNLLVPNQLPPHIKPGVRLYRNLDIHFQRTLHATRRIPVDICLRETPEGYCLSIANRSRSFEAEHQAALQADKARANIINQLSKLGDTIYCAGRVDVEWTTPRFIPISQLNLWRRLVIQDL